MFEEEAASKMSLLKRKLVYGVGINDAWYKIKDSKGSDCKYYTTWKNMLRRCYNYKEQEKFPTYIGCIVCEEWLTFSCFRLWMRGQDWEGKQLDKDLLIEGNKLYSSETCIFVSSGINNIMLDRAALRGKYPQGVTYREATNKYYAHCRDEGRQVYLGQFPTEQLAEVAYLLFKSEVLVRLLNLPEVVGSVRLGAAIRRISDSLEGKMTKLKETNYD